MGFACGCIQGMDPEVLIDEIGDSIENEGVALQRAFALGAKDPGGLEEVHIVGVNLIER